MIRDGGAVHAKIIDKNIHGIKMTHPSLANRPKISQKSANLRTEKDHRSFGL